MEMIALWWASRIYNKTPNVQHEITVPVHVHAKRLTFVRWHSVTENRIQSTSHYSLPVFTKRKQRDRERMKKHEKKNCMRKAAHSIGNDILCANETYHSRECNFKYEKAKHTKTHETPSWKKNYSSCNSIRVFFDSFISLRVNVPMHFFNETREEEENTFLSIEIFDFSM